MTIEFATWLWHDRFFIIITIILIIITIISIIITISIGRGIKNSDYPQILNRDISSDRSLPKYSFKILLPSIECYLLIGSNIRLLFPSQINICTGGN